MLSVSHIGGHKFAGNVIVYPGGIWYGRVQPCHVPAIIDETCVKGEVLQPLLRGSITAPPVKSSADMQW